MKVLLVLAALVMPQGEVYTKTLQGHVNFCQEYAGECTIDEREPTHIKWTPEIQAALEEVNSRVNREITPTRDEERWGGADVWDFAETGVGDCEDFQLVKRRELVAMGIPHRALRMAVVIDATGSGHAVMLVLTDAGDLVLDNQFDEVVFSQHSPHHFIKRESSFTHAAWANYVQPSGEVVVASR